jgi:UDP-GlcNAc:undecaprenyl-phosphate GlcNAc-1-phosphate transferase
MQSTKIMILASNLIFFPIFILLAIFLSKKLNLVDKPNLRKVHKVDVVNISGIIISIFMVTLIGITEYSESLENIIIFGFLMALIGFFDDRSEMKPSTKFFLMLFPTSYLILNGFTLTNLGKYEFINMLELGKASIPFTFLAVMLLINAINYIDGTDGLLIGYAITALLYFYFLSDKHSQYLSLILIFIYFLFVSLIFNFLPIQSGFKSFMGDSGSLFVSFFISFTLIFLYKYKSIHPAFLIWACWLPVYDFLHVTFQRLIIRSNFSNPDKSHFHHYVLNYFKNDHLKTFLFINLVNLLIISFGYLVCIKIGKIYSLLLFILLFFVFILIKLNLKKYNQ